MRLLNPGSTGKLYTYSLAATAATLPFSVKLSSVSIILLVLTWLLEGQWQKKWQLAKQNGWVLFFLTFFLLHVIGLLYTINLKVGWFDVEKKLSLFLLPLVLGTALSQQEISRTLVLKVFLLSCFTVAVYCTGSALYRFWHHIPPATSVYGGFVATQAFKSQHDAASPLWEYITYSELASPLQLHPTYLSMYVVLITVFLLQSLLQKRNTAVKRNHIWWGQLFLFLLLSGFLFLLSSRIMLLVYVCLVCFICFLRLYHTVSTAKLATGVVIFVVLLGLAGASIPVVRHRFTSDISMVGKSNEDVTPGTGMYTRLMYWKAATWTIMHHPLLGAGTGDMQDQMDLFYQEHDLEAMIGMNAHDQYLQTGAMLGIPAMVYLLLLIGVPLVYAWKRKDLLYLCFLLLVGAAFCTESILQSNKGIVFYALFNALFFFGKRNGHFPPVKN